MDDEIEFLHEIRASRSTDGNNDICQLCSVNLGTLSTALRRAHYEDHNKGDFIKPQSKGKRRLSQPTASASTQRRPKAVNSRNRAEDEFWYPTQSRPPPPNYTPGLLTILKHALKKLHERGDTQRAVLCYERTAHIFRETFDAGWGCGYRNFLMACAALMDQQDQTLYFPLLDDPIPPGVRNLQQWIENAWKQGYDEIGAKQLNHKLVGTRTMIGTGELFVAFSSRGVPSLLIDFDFRRSMKGFSALTDWVVNYFSDHPGKQGNINDALRNASAVITTTKMPIIMQYEGHSVTIVGYELSKTGAVNLLTFDPSRKVEKDIRAAALAGPGSVTWSSQAKISGLQPQVRNILAKGKRRERSASPVSNKRLRPSDNSDDEPVIVDHQDQKSSNKIGAQYVLSPDVIVKEFRFSTSKLKKRHEVQLLYFPMDNPLSPMQQHACKVVSSTIGC